MKTSEPLHSIDVSATGVTVWVNAIDGSCVGRFDKRFGMDVHRTVTEMLNGAPECLNCSKGRAGPAEWRKFCAEIKRHYGITVPPDTISF